MQRSAIGGRVSKNPRLFSFVGSDAGAWKVIDQRAIKGDPLDLVSHVDVLAGDARESLSGAHWSLQGVTSNERYVTRSEKAALTPIQPNLGRPEASCAVMIPLKKNDAWWALTQEDRRDIFHRSKHNEIGMKSLPAIARRLHHCRDLATEEEFDFVTWFEFSPADSNVFDDLMNHLRTTEEWSYIDREYELRMEAKKTVAELE